MRRVSSAGGVSAALTSLDPSGKERYHARPQFLPDGRHFLYLATGAQPENSAIYVASLDSPKEAKRLMSTTQGAAYAPAQKDGPGHLLFLREGTLMAQPFEEKRLELAGEAFPVAEQVGSIRTQAYFSVSTNGVLAYRSGAGGNGQLAWFDRAGKQMQTVGSPGEYSDVALSPDERRVAVARRDPQGANPDLWLIDLARSTPSRFTFHEAVDRLPVWSPDGARIAFSSSRDGPDSIYQKVASGAGSDELLLKASGDPIVPTDWSSDGRYLLYASQNAKTGLDLWVLPLEGDRKPAIYLQTPFNERQSRFSPDGKFIAYASDESGRYEVYVQPFPASGAKWMISSGGGAYPRWRRDGREIYYLSSGNKLMAVEVKTAPKFEAALPQPLFDARLFTGLNLGVFPYAPAANGQRFLINSVQGETASAPITIVQNWTSGVKR